MPAASAASASSTSSASSATSAASSPAAGAPFALHGRVALVTGGAQGLGEAIAAGLAAAGAHVLVVARSVPRVAAAVDRLRALGGSAEGLPLDITDDAAVEAAFAHIDAAHGRLDIWSTMPARASAVPWQSSARPSCAACWRPTGGAVCAVPPRRAAHARRGLRAHRQRQLDRRPVARYGDVLYPATKGGLDALTRAMAAELGREGITVNAVAPGYFATEPNQPMVADATVAQWLRDRTSLGRWGRPDEVAGAVVFWPRRPPPMSPATCWPSTAATSATSNSNAADAADAVSGADPDPDPSGAGPAVAVVRAQVLDQGRRRVVSPRSFRRIRQISRDSPGICSGRTTRPSRRNWNSASVGTAVMPRPAATSPRPWRAVPPPSRLPGAPGAARRPVLAHAAGARKMDEGMAGQCLRRDAAPRGQCVAGRADQWKRSRSLARRAGRRPGPAPAPARSRRGRAARGRCSRRPAGRTVRSRCPDSARGRPPAAVADRPPPATAGRRWRRAPCAAARGRAGRPAPPRSRPAGAAPLPRSAVRPR